MKPIRAVGIVIRGGKILLMHRIDRGKDYYTFPGGGVEAGETVPAAVARELQEETSIEVAVGQLLYSHDYGSSEQYYYLCDYQSGDPKLDENSVEMAKMKTGNNIYEPVWVDTARLSEYLLYPLEIRDWLMADLITGFPDQPKTARLKIEELRQSI